MAVAIAATVRVDAVEALRAAEANAASVAAEFTRRARVEETRRAEIRRAGETRRLQAIEDERIRLQCMEFDYVHTYDPTVDTWVDQRLVVMKSDYEKEFKRLHPNDHRMIFN